jgi:RNA polymerase sigma-70 factor (ECF subfamily)
MPFRLWLRKTTQERLLKARRMSRRSVGRWPARSRCPIAPRCCSPSNSSPAGPAPADSSSATSSPAASVALALLTEIDREVLLLRNFEALSNPEIGHVLDLDPATVSKRHGRALMRLQQLLTQGGMTESQL